MTDDFETLPDSTFEAPVKPTAKAPLHRDVTGIDKEILVFFDGRYVVTECQTCGGEDRYNPGTTAKEIAINAFEHVCGK